MVILAKSYKTGGRCLAGRLIEYTANKKSVNVGAWIRPVPNDGYGHSSLSKDMYTYEDGTEANILDIVEIPLAEKSSTSIVGQPENIIFSSDIRWKKINTLKAESITSITENTDTIWLEGNSPTNSVSSLYAENGFITQSLYLIQPANFKVILSNEFNEYDGEYKKKIFAEFDYNGVLYTDISITCPSTRRVLTNQYPNEGKSAITMPLRKGDNYVLCLSIGLGIGNENRHIKFVATVFDYDGYLQREYAV